MLFFIRSDAKFWYRQLDEYVTGTNKYDSNVHRCIYMYTTN